MEVKLDESYFQGCVSVERVGDALRPWRLPHTQRHLFPSPNDTLMSKAACTSGVRLRFQTDAQEATLRFEPLPEPHSDLPNGHVFDVVIDNEIVQTQYVGEGATSVTFNAIGEGMRCVELWLVPSAAVSVTGLDVPDGTSISPLPDRRPLWVTWGSSLTHCVRAGSAARTWPATVARRFDLNLLSLGFGGDCHLEPMVAMLIRDLPADHISLKLGINTVGGTVAARTYPALVTAAVQIIREKHPHTPLALVSPIGYPPHETTPNVVGYTIEGMRRDMEAVHHSLVEAGDLNLHYVNGLEIFSVADIEIYSKDQCHPNAEGTDLKADRFCDKVMPLLVGRRI